MRPSPLRFHSVKDAPFAILMLNVNEFIPFGDFGLRLLHCFLFAESNQIDLELFGGFLAEVVGGERVTCHDFLPLSLIYLL